MDQGNLQPDGRQPDSSEDAWREYYRSKDLADVARESQVVTRRRKKIVNNDLLGKWDQMNEQEDGPNYEEPEQTNEPDTDTPESDDGQATTATMDINAAFDMAQKMALQSYSLGLLAHILHVYGSDVFEIEESSPAAGRITVRGVKSNNRFKIEMKLVEVHGFHYVQE